MSQILLKIMFTIWYNLYRSIFMTQFFNSFISPSITVVKSKWVLNVCDISFAPQVCNVYKA